MLTMRLSIPFITTTLFLLILSISYITAGEPASNKRCKCLCKRDIELDIPSKIYVSANEKIIKTANDCNCMNAVVPTLKNEHKDGIDETEYCKLCGCEFETRNVKIINFSMNFYLLTIVFLFFYYLFIKFGFVPRNHHDGDRMIKSTNSQNSNNNKDAQTDQHHNHNINETSTFEDDLQLTGDGMLNQNNNEESLNIPSSENIQNAGMHSSLSQRRGLINNNELMKRVTNEISSWQDTLDAQRESVYDKQECLH